jgi:two-component system NtrC family sensor kinase
MHILGSPIFLGGFVPYGCSYLWSTGLIALHAISGAPIAIACVPNPITLPHFTRKRKDIPFRWIFPSLAAFTAAPPDPAHRWEWRP